MSPSWLCSVGAHGESAGGSKLLAQPTVIDGLDGVIVEGLTAPATRQRSRTT